MEAQNINRNLLLRIEAKLSYLFSCFLAYIRVNYLFYIKGVISWFAFVFSFYITGYFLLQGGFDKKEMLLVVLSFGTYFLFIEKLKQYFGFRALVVTLAMFITFLIRKHFIFSFIVGSNILDFDKSITVFAIFVLFNIVYIIYQIIRLIIDRKRNKSETIY